MADSELVAHESAQLTAKQNDENQIVVINRDEL